MTTKLPSHSNSTYVTIVLCITMSMINYGRCEILSNAMLLIILYAILSQARLKITVTTALIWQRKLYDRMSMVAKC